MPVRIATKVAIRKDTIERTTSVHPRKLAESESAAVLHCSLESLQNNTQSFLFAQIVRGVILSAERTRSPVARERAGFSFVSKSHGVRPITSNLGEQMDKCQLERCDPLRKPA